MASTNHNGIVRLSNFCKNNKSRSRRHGQRQPQGHAGSDGARSGSVAGRRDDDSFFFESPDQNISNVGKFNSDDGHVDEKYCSDGITSETARDENAKAEANADANERTSEWNDGKRNRNPSFPASVRVMVSILRSLPPSPLRMRSWDGDGDELEWTDIGIDSDIDDHATIYTDDVELLLALQIFDGQICMLSRYCGDGDEDGRRAPVFLKTLHHELHSNNKRDKNERMVDLSWLKLELDDYNHDNSNSPRSPHFRIYIPPCVAATIGCYSYSLHSEMESVYLSSVNQGQVTMMRMNNNHHHRDGGQRKASLSSSYWPMATKAKMVEVAPPPSDHMPSHPRDLSLDKDNKLKLQRRRRREMEKNRQIELLQAHFYRKESKEPVSRLVTSGTMIAIVDDGDDKTDDGGHEHQNKDSACLRSGIRFYKILSVECDDTQPVVDDVDDHFCFMTPDTKMVLIPSKEGELGDIVHRLPQLDTVRSFHNSLSKKKKNIERSPSEHEVNYDRHPSLATIMESLLSLGTCNYNHSDALDPYSSSPPNLLHIIGDEDNHMMQCFDTAAGIVGMNIIHIDGLAAFSFRQKLYNEEETSQTIVGSFGDKLAGIKSVFHVARKTAPCIIRIRLDEEIIQSDDVESRHDEESRILSCIREETMIAMKTIRSNGVLPVLVVVSTEKDLPKGPLSSALFFYSLTLDAPDDNYARELWGHHDTYESVQKYLLGRSANEILMLADAFRQQKNDLSINQSHPEVFSPERVFLSLLEDSPERVSMFKTDAKKLSSDLIPNVKWEDVGGLSHVRDEIIDAIELPLKHPDLFRGSRRAGILLFGAPGCGKSLVAKAIATECGLPFLSVKGPELLGSYVGESEANIRAAFASAREAASDSIHKGNGGAAILFFDEIDSLAPRRGGLGDGGGVMERVVSTILGELDKVGQVDDRGQHAGHVFIIGATNRPDLLDPSLLRPGRFDRLVYLGLPTAREDRISILAAQTRKFSFEAGVDARTMAKMAIDFIPESLSGADFSAVASGALMLALQRVCDEADDEKKFSASADQPPVQDILSSWPEDKLVARVSLEDIISASQMVTPSVSKEDLQKYQGMQNEYCGYLKKKKG